MNSAASPRPDDVKLSRQRAAVDLDLQDQLVSLFRFRIGDPVVYARMGRGHHISAHFLFWAPKAPKAPKAEITLMSVTFRERSFMIARKLGNRRVSAAAFAKASTVVTKALQPLQKLCLPDGKLY